MKSNSGKIISSIKNNESKLALEFPPATVAIPYAAFSYVINLNNFFYLYIVQYIIYVDMKKIINILFAGKLNISGQIATKRIRQTILIAN